MTRDEWHGSRKAILLRLANNFAADITHKAQELREILALIDLEYESLLVCDRFNVCERQLRVTSLEAHRLWAELRNLDNFLSPKSFDDMTVPKKETSEAKYSHGSEHQQGTVQ